MQFWNLERIVSWIKLSVSISTLAVASSSTIILEFRSIARARQSSCLWPVENTDVASETCVSSPSSHLADRTNRASCTASRASQSSSVEWFPKGSRFSRIDPMKRKGCWGIIAIDSLNKLSPISEISTPSISIRPPSCLSFSTILNSAYNTEDLPAPVRPTTPTFICPSIANDNFFNTGSNSGLYRIVKFLNSILPLYGHSAALISTSSGFLVSASLSKLVYSLIRWTLVIEF